MSTKNGKRYSLAQLRSAWGAGKADGNGSDDPLVGKWFHSFDGPDVKWQGQILHKAPVPDHYLVQLYEWVIGNPSDQQMVSALTMIDWKFYDSDSEMRETFYRKYGK